MPKTKVSIDPAAGSSPLVQPSPLAPATVTEVYASYWRFAAERQKVYRRRIRGDVAPWTQDAVLGCYKFTNAYRAADRVSQYLIRHVIYRSDLPDAPEEVLFRILLFKLFNKIETWQLLERSFGVVTLKSFNIDRYDAVLSAAMQRKERIYSAAYIMPPGGGAFGCVAKHQNHLNLLQYMLRDRLSRKLSRTRSMQEAFELLLAYPTIGDFLAYQFVTDINYSELVDFTEMDFVVPGPGARDGLSKCFSHFGGLNEAELIRLMADLQEQEFTRFGVAPVTLWGRRLQLIDCQNLFCEISKYARVAHPEAIGISGRRRIKQKFAPNAALPEPWFPPKWGLNQLITAEMAVARRSVQREEPAVESSWT